MKKTLFLLLIILAGSSLKVNHTFAQIKFETGSWAEIKAKAKAENKLIFLDAYTEWCGPCKWMAKNVFSNDTVANYYNTSFVNAKIDMEKGEGIDIAKLYAINVYPSLLFIDGNGNIIHRVVGARNNSDFLLLGKDAQIPEKQFKTLDENYKRGQKDAAFIKLYLNALWQAGMEINDPLTAYFNTQKDADLLNRENWDMIHTFVDGFESREFSFLLKNRDLYSKLYTADSVNNKIYEVCIHQCIQYIYATNEDSTKYIPLKEEIQNSGFIRTDELLLETDIAYFHKKMDFTNFANVVSEFVEKYKSNDAERLNNFAYLFFKNVKDKNMLAKAEIWAKKAYELDPNPSLSMDTYASLLYANGKKDEAIALEKKVIEIIKSDPKKYDQSFIVEAEKKIVEWSE